MVVVMIIVVMIDGDNVVDNVIDIAEMANIIDTLDSIEGVKPGDEDILYVMK